MAHKKLSTAFKPKNLDYNHMLYHAVNNYQVTYNMPLHKELSVLRAYSREQNPLTCALHLNILNRGGCFFSGFLWSAEPISNVYVTYIEFCKFFYQFVSCYDVTF